jgi:hypothetical protein
VFNAQIFYNIAQDGLSHLFVNIFRYILADNIIVVVTVVIV